MNEYYIAKTNAGLLYLLIYVLPLEIQLSRGGGWDPTNGFNSTTFLRLSQARTWVPNAAELLLGQSAKSNNWLVRNRNNVSNLTDISSSPSWASTIKKIQLSVLVLVQSGHLYHLIECKNLIDLIWFLMFNASSSNISAISWRPVLVVEEPGVPGENHRPLSSNW